MSSKDLIFEDLVAAIEQTHAAFAAQAGKAVNISLTLRNWFIGHRIAEYELVGADRASYGERLIEQLADRLGQTGLKRLDSRELRRFVQFYRAYPQIREALSPVLASLPAGAPFTLPSIRETPSPESGAMLPAGPGPRLLLERLSFSHFAELLQIEPSLKRLFYEVETLRGNWSVRELKRQIATQYFERSGLSTDKEALARLTHSQAEPQSSQHVIRDPYVFEFLGLRAQEVMTERKLEDALLDRLLLRTKSVVVPSVELLVAFEGSARAIYGRRYSQVARTLATLRDTLLPRLISGQLRLPGAEALAATA